MEILKEEFMQPLSLTQAALAEAMGVPRKHMHSPRQRERIKRACPLKAA